MKTARKAVRKAAVAREAGRAARMRWLDFRAWLARERAAVRLDSPLLRALMALGVVLFVLTSARRLLACLGFWAVCGLAMPALASAPLVWLTQEIHRGMLPLPHRAAVRRRCGRARSRDEELDFVRRMIRERGRLPGFDRELRGLTKNYSSSMLIQVGTAYYLDGPMQNQAEAIKWLILAAQRGDPQACSNVGLMYSNGEGISKDPREAMKWFLRAAEHGDADCQAKVGHMSQIGEGVPQNYAEAVKWYRHAAEHGHAVAQNNLGVLYADGKGVPQDKIEAVKWYHMAANQGHGTAHDNLLEVLNDARPAAERGDATAQCILGYMFHLGAGVPQDDGEALMMFRLAAEQNHSAAQYNMAWAYVKGREVPQNDAEALRWFRLAAKQGHVKAQRNMGFMYSYGRGGTLDEGVDTDAQALAWYHRAAKQGEPEAQCRYGWMFVQEDDEKAAKWFRLAAEQGYSKAQIQLAKMYANGNIKARADAVKWVFRAAWQGHAWAQYDLGIMYGEGDLTLPKSKADADEWLRKAAMQGNEAACHSLGTMHNAPISEAEIMGIDGPLPNNLLECAAEAYVWYALAVEGGDGNALGARDRMAAYMPPTKLAEAKARVRRLAEQMK